MMDVNQQLSVELANKGACRLGLCYDNCEFLVRFVTPDAYYVEGNAIIDGKPISHCWLIIDNQIVDPTYALMKVYADGYIVRRMLKKSEIEDEIADRGYFMLLPPDIEDRLWRIKVAK